MSSSSESHGTHDLNFPAMSETKEVAGLVERLRSRATKLGGDEVQELVTVRGTELLHLATTLEANAREIERLTAERERQWCLSCGTVTRDGTCDCTKTIPQAQNLVNYADELSKDVSTLAGQVSTLTRQLEEARGNALEDAASVADDAANAEKLMWDTHVASGVQSHATSFERLYRSIAAAIRSLKQGERE